MSKETIRFVAGLILTVMGSGATAITYAFATFETKEHVKEDLVKRLDRFEENQHRLEDKIDRLIERQ